LYQLLADDNAEADHDAINMVISVLKVDESSNKAYAKDCAQVLADFGSLMSRLGAVNFSKSASRKRTFRSGAPGLPSHSSVILSSDTLDGSGGYVDSYRHAQASPATSHTEVDATVSNGSAPSPFDRRAYNELVSWLEADHLQHRFDFPHRAG
jgi:hypothetical protein